MKIRFLLDENLSKQIKFAVLRLNPAIDILGVGDLNAPSFGTLDPEILIYVEASQRLLITDNRKSMLEHLEAHWSAGRHVSGIFILNPSLSIGQNIDELILIAEGSFDDEYQDQIIHLPIT